MEAMIRMLHLEDDPADAELVQATLAEAGLACRTTRAQTRDEFEAALRDGGTDIILADYRLPTYDGLSALWLSRELCSDIPFIFVSGVMGEEAAIEALTQGATDYVLKHNLSRLAPAVKRALKEVEERCERERAERALQKSEAKMRSILDLVDEGFIVVDRKYCILSANKAFCTMVNQSEDQVLGRLCHEVLHHTARSCFKSGEKCPVRYALETGKSSLATHTHLDASGAQQHIELKSYPIIDMSGSVTSVIMTLNNVTERKNLQDRLRQAQKMEAIGTLAGGIAHDFNNILSSVIGFTEIVLDYELPQDAPARGSLENVLTAALRARDLVKQIMAFSRRSQYEKKPIILMPIVKEALKLIRASLPTNIEIRPNVDASNIKIMGDATQIHQVFMNLCANAGHAMRKNGGILEVVLSMVEFSHADPERPPDLNPGVYVMLSVTDTGCGIPPSVLDQIFNPYFTTKSKEEGTGLGLSVVHGIVKEHDGAIKVDSEPGKGTTFKLYFPLLDNPTERADVAEKPLAFGHERILVVDDEKKIAVLFQKALERLGYKVTAVNKSLDALSLFTEDPTGFDLVITDQTMPGMTGDQLALKLLALRLDIPIILSTGFSHVIDEAHAKSIGIRDVIMKPVACRELAAAVRRVLDQSQNRRWCGEDTDSR